MGRYVSYAEVTCNICKTTVRRERVKLPVLCSPTCRATMHRARERVKRLSRQLIEAKTELAGYGIDPYTFQEVAVPR